MKILFLIIIVFALLFVSVDANAVVSDGTRISMETIMPLAEWVEQKTHQSLPFLPIAVASDRRLERALRLDGAQHAGAMGAYLPGRLIVSSEMWNPDSLEAKSYVVHELVHHAQFISGRTYICSSAKEREAYMLQSAWLVEQGLKPLVTPDWIDKMSKCDQAVSAPTQN